MMDKVLKFLDEQIEEGEILLKQASGEGLTAIHGALNAFEEIKEFIEDLAGDDEDAS